MVKRQQMRNNDPKGLSIRLDWPSGCAYIVWADFRNGHKNNSHWRHSEYPTIATTENSREAIFTNNRYPKQEVDDVIKRRLDMFMSPPSQP
ncbi:hypothetical protein E2C01_007144 [Portunus trituberculatus]|uniref:Uncharacterized protein n=1 Tax=Portunus trituberculatus TaxID=210409 RepID=A0A5B7CY63_PORTR|nr:hypothetical protein [Portunus trituberculatus]